MIDGDGFLDDIEYVMKYRMPHRIPIDGVKLVWYCKTLQNKKAVVITSPWDGNIYEATYNGDKNEMYLDRYEKAANIVFDGQELKARRERTLAQAWDGGLNEKVMDGIDELRERVKAMREQIDKQKE